MQNTSHNYVNNLPLILPLPSQREQTIINNPSQPLSELNLESYTVLDSEPLHDLKGHLINLLTELPHILSGECKKLTKDLLENLLFSKKNKMDILGLTSGLPS